MRTYYLVALYFLTSCTSNTIFEKPKDLIPRDTMSLLIQDMIVATSAKSIKNKNKQKNVNYMPFIYDKYKIDSIRFQNSNFYYTSKIDLYEEIISEVKTKIEKTKKRYVTQKKLKDSIRIDSIKKIKLKRLDSIKAIDSL